MPIDPATLSAIFHTTEPFKAVAIRLRMSPNTLRSLWVGEFGADAFRARGKKCHLEGNAASRGKPREKRVFQEKGVLCSKCGKTQQIRKIGSQRINLATFLCDACEALRFDRTCPVCGQGVNGVRGLSMHFRHRREAGDEAHIGYQRDQEAQRGVEGVDFVSCLICGHKAQTLAVHLSSHQITADEYRARFGKVPIRSTDLARRRSKAMSQREAGFGKGETKVLACPKCGASHTVSKFLVPGTHDLRCETCQDTSPWEGSRMQLTREQLSPFCHQNGRFSLTRAQRSLGFSIPILRREAHRVGLRTHRRVSQTACLEAVSQALGLPYIEEWNSAEFLNPKTGRRFRFDGYFPELKLVVEFHGVQHWKFPNQYMKPHHRLLWDLQRERDRIKEEMIRNAPGMRYLVIREDEPYQDVQYLKGRLGL